MSWRKQNSPNEHDRVPAYYANNKLYPKSYTNTVWLGRNARRVHDGLSIPMNFGLDTTSDDLNSSPYSSPYYINGRFNSQDTVTQRSSASSIQGTKRLFTIGDIVEDFTKEDEQTSIQLWQGKQIKFEIPYSGKVVGNTLSIRNTDGCTGILSIYISTSENGQPIYETAVDLCKVSVDFFEHLTLYAMTPIARKANPRGVLYVRMEIWDEIEQERSANPFNTGRKIDIAATGLGNHWACEYKLTDKNLPVRETYDYKRLPSRPCFGFIYNPYTSVPTNRHEAQDIGAVVTKDNYRYAIFCYKDSSEAHVAVYDIEMNKLVEGTDIKVDGRVEALNLVQAADMVYYVDGYSTLQKFKIGEWRSEAFPASAVESVSATVDVATFAQSTLGSETGDYLFVYRNGMWKYEDAEVVLSDFGITVTGSPADSGQITVTYVAASTTTEASASAEYTDARPVIAASIICKHYNRIYLGGFRFDPNLVQCTEITAEGPDWDSYLYRFYVPDEAPQATSTNRVAAMVPYSTDTLMILSNTSFSLWNASADFEGDLSKASPSQVSTYIDGGGVSSDGDVCNYRGVVYSFDPDEGIRRYSGSIWQTIPESIDSYYERVDMEKPRKLWGYAHRLYFNYTDKVDGKAKCLVWDQDMNYQQYPWFQDSDVPFCDVRCDNDFDLIGIHPDYPCIMKLYDHDTWRRLDTPITFERHTKYMSIPGNAHNMILERVHNKVLANANRWWWFSLSPDTDTWTQSRGVDKWYRFPCWDTLQVEEPPESPFPTQDVYESNAVSLLSINNIRIRAISVQEKVKCKTFRNQACLLSILFEAYPEPLT